MASSKGKSKAKKDFDKDYIFNLIMPSGPQTEMPEESAAPDPVPESAPPDSLSLLRDRISHNPVVSSVQLRPGKNQVLVNLMEQLVADRLDSAFDKFKCCRCDKCRRDVAAYALNLLPPHYVVAEPDELPGLLAQCSTKEVFTALVKAILYVKSNPKH